MKILFSLAIAAALCSTVAAQTTTVRVLPVHFPTTALPELQVFCASTYDRNACTQDASYLVRQLHRYPVGDLGSWNFLLIPSDNWRETVVALRHDPTSPAFSVLDARITVFESSLFHAPPDRTKQFLGMFGISGRPLLDLAITHEIGHALCSDFDEHRADENGKKLREGARVECAVSKIASGAGR